MTARAHVHLVDGGTAGSRREPPGPEKPPFGVVLDRVQAALRSIGHEAARRFGVDVDDAVQEARIIAWQKHEAGLPARLVVQYTRQAMLSPERSPFRTASSTRSRTEAEAMPSRQDGFHSPLTNGQVRALARLSSSPFGGILSRVERGAPMTCPACGGPGAWGNRWDGSPRPDGERAGRCIENEAEARERWPLYDAPRKARDDQVWWCSRCGGWTWDPEAKAREVRIAEERLTVLLHGHEASSPSAGEEELMRYVEAGRRQRRGSRNG